jgi:hypothetical protein
MENTYVLNRELQNSSKETWSEARGRRKGCKAKGLKGKAFRECLREERKEDRKKTPAQKRAAAKARREEYAVAIAEGEISPSGFGRLGYAAKRATLSPVRGAFMALLRLNVFGFASKISILEQKSNSSSQAEVVYKKVLANWVKFGGKISNLKSGINAGKSKKPVFSQLPKGAKGHSNAAGTTGLAATLAAATPLIIAIGGVLQGASSIIGGFKTNEVSPEDQAIFTDFENEHGMSQDESDAILAEEKQRKTTNAIIIGVAAAVVIGVAAFVVIKNKRANE